MLEVLLFSQKDVKARLFERASASGLLLVTAVRHSAHMRPIPEREPFRTLERLFGDVLTTVVVADDGTAEGMWRDPVGDLAEKLFPADRTAAYAAASGYLVLVDGEADAVLKKGADPVADVWFLQEALAAAHPEIPRPDPARRPRGTKPAGSGSTDPRGGESGPRGAESGSRGAESGPRGAESGPRGAESGPRGGESGPRGGESGPRSAESGPRGAQHGARGAPSDASWDGRSPASQQSGFREERASSHRPREAPRGRGRGDGSAEGGAESWGEDPWALLGVTPEVSLTEARKAFRALMAQYHPDKVAHLAPEFRELAERRSRQIAAAWEHIERELE